MAGYEEKLKKRESELRDQPLTELRFLWKDLTGTPASLAMSQTLLVQQILTYYRAHPELLGSKRRLDLPPGTILYRFYGRKIHKVTVRDDGFEYEGKVYKRISTIACVITGHKTRSGVEFFGKDSGHCWRERIV